MHFRSSRRRTFELIIGFAIALAFGPADAQSPSATAKAELAPSGKLRVAFPLNALTAPKNATTGALEGLIADLGRELAGRLGVPAEAIESASPGKFSEVAEGDVWDITLMAPDPSRTRFADWTTPLFESDYAYLV